MTDQVTAPEGAAAATPAEPFKSKAVPPSFSPPADPPAEPVVEVEEEEVEEVEESPEAPATEDKPRQPQNKGVGKRINELTREKHDALRERDYWKEQALSKQAPAPKEEPPAPTQAAPTGEPKPEDFDFDLTKFNRAHYEWMRKNERQQEAISERQRTFAEKETAFRAAHPDYDDVAKAPHVPITETVAQAILETEDPPAIAYYLGQHLDEAAAIARMTPIAAARAIGRIEASLAAPPAPAPTPPAPKKTTSAPPPPKTVQGSGKPGPSEDDPEISTAARIALWRKRKGLT